MNERGRTLLEVVIVLALILLSGSLLVPSLRAYSQEAQIMGAAQEFQGRFREAYSMAVRSNVGHRHPVRDGRRRHRPTACTSTATATGC